VVKATMESSYDFPLILQRTLFLASQLEHVEFFHVYRLLNSMAYNLENKYSMLGQENYI